MSFTMIQYKFVYYYAGIGIGLFFEGRWKLVLAYQTKADELYQFEESDGLINWTNIGEPYSGDGAIISTELDIETPVTTKRYIRLNKW